MKFFDSPCLFRSRILDRLRLVDNRELPFDLDKLRDARQKTIARDHEIHRLEHLRCEMPHFDWRHCRRMRDHSPQIWSKTPDFRYPVLQKRGWGDEDTPTAGTIVLQNG